jgi:uncharacterized protein (DUF58 family)
MSYNPADLRLPSWLVKSLDAIIRLRLPLGLGWTLSVTRPGAILVATMAGVCAAALYSGNNLLYLCAAMLLCLGGGGLIAGILLLRSVPDITACMPEISTTGRVHVLRRALSFRCTFPAIVQGRWQGVGTQAAFFIRCAGEAFLHARLSAASRSLVRFSSLVLSSEAPLGLWHLERHIEGRTWLWAVIPDALNWYVHRFPTLPDAGEWRDLRAYLPGDAPSRIHWRKSTDPSTSGWQVKRFAGENEPHGEALLRVDMRASQGPAFERLLGESAGWMQEHPTGRIILGKQRFDLSDAAQHLQAWRCLASATPEDSPPAGTGGALLAVGGMHAR